MADKRGTAKPGSVQALKSSEEATKSKGKGAKKHKKKEFQARTPMQRVLVVKASGKKVLEWKPW